MSDNSTILMPHVQKRIEEQDRIAREGLVGQAHRITCPHCTVGAAIVTTEQRKGAVDIPNGKIVTCESCGRHFLIGVQIKLYGKPLPQS